MFSTKVTSSKKDKLKFLYLNLRRQLFPELISTDNDWFKFVVVMLLCASAYHTWMWCSVEYKFKIFTRNIKWTDNTYLFYVAWRMHFNLQMNAFPIFFMQYFSRCWIERNFRKGKTSFPRNCNLTRNALEFKVTHRTLGCSDIIYNFNELCSIVIFGWK